jgi:molybdenum cofactor synthesis domain-containing protein
MALVRFFAAAREAASTSTWQCNAESVQELLEEAVKEFGNGLRELLPYCTIMVGDEKAPADSPIRSDSEVAILPPVSGGSGDFLRVAILTVSDRAHAGEYADETGPVIQQCLETLHMTVVTYAVIPDDRERIEATLREWALTGIADVIVTNGGTGIGPRDVTPEATQSVIERELPGIPETMRAAGREHTPLAALSRQVAGTVGNALIINLPGSPKAAQQCLDAVTSLLPHAVALLRGSADVHA